LEEMGVRLVGDWEQHCKPETALMVYEDVNALWKELMEAAKIDIWDTITHGQANVTIIRPVEAPANRMA
jgi:hypothetical protein